MESKHRVALITGCGKPIGIGSATARKLAAAGVSVMVSDVTDRGVESDNERGSDPDSSWSGLNSLVDEITAAGGIASAVRGDVSSEADVARIVETTLRKFGRLDILVNNAGAPHGADRGDIENVPVEAWNRVMMVNSTSVFLTCRAVTPAMRAQRWGRIINIASAAGMQALPQRAAYSASKAAVIGLTRSLAYDLAPVGITVNAVCPGSVWTTRAISTTRAAGWEDIEVGRAERAKGIPMGRHADVSEIASVVAFLASDGGSYLTGQALVIDGGGLNLVTARQ